MVRFGKPDKRPFPIGHVSAALTIGQILDASPGGVGYILEADGVADLVAEEGADLLGDSGSDACCSDSSGLGACDDSAVLRPSGLEAVLGQLGGLPRARLALDNQHGVVLEHPQELLAWQTEEEENQHVGYTPFAYPYPYPYPCMVIAPNPRCLKTGRRCRCACRPRAADAGADVHEKTASSSSAAILSAACEDALPAGGPLELPPRVVLGRMNLDMGAMGRFFFSDGVM